MSLLQEFFLGDEPVCWSSHQVPGLRLAYQFQSHCQAQQFVQRVAQFAPLFGQEPSFEVRGSRAHRAFAAVVTIPLAGRGELKRALEFVDVVERLKF
jgi:hypothetical protein